MNQELLPLQPNFIETAATVRDGGNALAAHLERCQNIPALDNGNEILRQLVRMERQASNR